MKISRDENKISDIVIYSDCWWCERWRNAKYELDEDFLETGVEFILIDETNGSLKLPGIGYKADLGISLEKITQDKL
jgi:hypothetical protein